MKQIIEIDCYEGETVIFYPREKRFEWNIEAQIKTTAKFRKDFEKEILDDLKN